MDSVSILRRVLVVLTSILILGTTILGGGSQSQGNPPEIPFEIEFPQEITADGKRTQSFIFFKDPDQDITVIRFKLTKPYEAEPLSFDPQVKGKLSGVIKFSIAATAAPLELEICAGEGEQCKRLHVADSAPAEVSLRVTLVDERGNESKPKEFAFKVISPAILKVSPTSLSFQGQAGGPQPDPQYLTISNAGSGLMKWQGSADADWIVLGATEGKLSGGRTVQLLVLVNTTGLAAGAYQGTITVEAPGAQGSPAKVMVSLTLTAPPQLEVSPAKLEFKGQEGGSNPASQMLTIRNGGGQFLSWSATVDVAWISLNRTSGRLEAGTSQSVIVSVQIAGLAAGTHWGRITVTAPGAQGSPASVNVTLVLEARKTYTVCPSGCSYNSIGSAIAAARSGETITIGPGTYIENVEITKSLTLLGAGRDQTIIRSAQVGKPNAVINISGSGIQVSIEAVTVDGAKVVDNYGGHGIWADGSGRVIVRSSKISNNESNGIGTNRGIQVTIQDSLVVNNTWGIIVWGTGDIQNNTIIENGIGIQMTGVRASIRGNTISSNGVGIWAGLYRESPGQATIEDNKISGNGGTGVVFAGTFSATISRNDILNNGGWGVAAHLRKCGFDRDNFSGNVALSNNTITGNKQGQVCLP